MLYHRLTPEAYGRIKECSLVGIDRRAFPDKVGFHGTDEPRTMDELPGNEEYGSYFCLPWLAKKGMSRIVLRRSELTENQHGIVNKEVLDAPGLVGRVAVGADDENHPAETDVSAIRLEPAIVW